MSNKSGADLNKLRDKFNLLRDAVAGEEIISQKTKQLEGNGYEYLAKWYKLSQEDDKVYPSQGLLLTPHDYLDVHALQMLPQDTIVQTLKMRMFFLELFNHPYRIHFLKQATINKFRPVPKVESKAFEYAVSAGISLSIGDLGAGVVGSHKPRRSRTDRYAQGPFVKLGKQARTFFVGSASPDVWNSVAAIATMAASHCLAGVPRNGVLNNVKRQTDVALEVFGWLKDMKKEILNGREDKDLIFKYWKNNVMGTVESSPKSALVRTKALYDAGVRTFRIYSPEPGNGPVETAKALRKEFGDEIEIFVGQIVDITQAKEAQDAGADGLYVGIGGGGRCITGVRSGSVIDWPNLLWQLRGEISIPVVVEGGASDHVAVALLLGASGIGVSRAVSGGTIESPGGALYCVDEKGKLFKPYGGEASARTKYLDKKLLPFNIPSFVEGETTKAYMSYIKHVLPTLTYNLHLLIEDAILALVFRNVENIYELHELTPSPLKQTTVSEQYQRNTH